MKKFSDKLYPKQNIGPEVFCLVTPQENFLDSTINMRAPIALNNGKGTQIVIDDDNCEVKLTLAELLARLAT